MARQGGATGIDDPMTGPPDRLRSMRLGPDRGGWVPEPIAGSADPDPPVAHRVETGVRAEPVAPPTPADLARDWVQDRMPAWAYGMVERAGVGSVLVGMAGLAAVVLAGVLLLHHHSASAYPPSYDAAPTSFPTAAGAGAAGPDPAVPSAPAATADATSIVVDVGGRVRKPGLVTLPPGARVADAITAAGGPLRHREIATLDLAARVTDGQLLLVGVKTPAADPPATSGGDPAAASSTAPVGLNSATLEELETLPGIGPVTGQKIIDWRTAHSGFTSIEQLQQVSGIGPATYAELSPLVTL